MAKTTIRFKLDEAEINRAIREVKAYKRLFLRKCESLVKELAAQGAEIARVQVAQLDAIYTGDLQNSIGDFFNAKTGVGIIRADTRYAIYVEFGTGVVGRQSPHPNPQGYQYDINNHGDEGWVYYDDTAQKWRWTKGFKSRPFMYNTARELEKECVRIAEEVFGR